MKENVMEISPVAVIRSPLGSKFGAPRQSGLADSLISRVDLLPPCDADYLRGLEGFDYIWLIFGFSANQPKLRPEATVRPPRLGGNVKMGVFATRSPFRPNSIGLSSVRLDHIDLEKPAIYVRGADLIDGTPIYDIKPYVVYADSHPQAGSGFVDSGNWTELEVMIPDSVKPENWPELEAAGGWNALEEVLRQDPRPSYQDDCHRIYGLLFAGRDVHFTVSDGILTVTDCQSV